MTVINSDILIEILIRLPIRSVIRFKSVSKQWYSLITNPEFRVRYRIISRKPDPAVGLFIYSHRNSWYEHVPFFSCQFVIPPFKKLNLFQVPSPFEIKSSCNGLLLCTIKSWYYVCNPTTKNMSILPELYSEFGGYRNVCGMSLVFDPAKSTSYKVVCVVKNGGRYHILIYSSEAFSWSFTGKTFTSEVDFENGVYWNDAINWVNDCKNGDSLYFNLDAHLVEKMPNTPPIYSRSNFVGGFDYYYGESCDHLHFARLGNPVDDIIVYEMKRDYSEWFVKYRVDLLKVVTAYRPMLLTYYSIFYVIRGDKDDESFMVLSIPGKIIRYNILSRKCETLHEFKDTLYEFKERSKRKSYMRGFQYVESLCSVQ